MEMVLNGRYGADGQLPTESELCQHFGLSRTPVHRALAELASDGVVIRHRRRGTFVAPEWLEKQAGNRLLTVVVPEGPWSHLVQTEAPADLTVSITVIELDSLHDYLTQAVASGDAPDLALVDSVWVPEFASAGYFRALDDLDARWSREEYRRGFAQAFVISQTIEDVSVAVQLEADVAGLWYDRKILRTAGIRPPRTWMELLEACKTLSRGGMIAPLVLPGGPASGEAATYCLLALLASNGSAILGPTGVLPDRALLVEALEYIQTLVAAEAIRPECVDYTRDQPIKMLATGQAVFAFGGSYELPALAANAGLDQERTWGRFGFLPTPAGTSGPPAMLAGGMALGIFRQAKRPDLALHLIQSLVSSGAQSRMAKSTGQIPTRTSVISSVAGEDSLLAQSSAMLEGAVVRPAVPSYDRVSQQLQKMFADIILGRISPSTASEYTAELISAITGIPVAQA